MALIRCPECNKNISESANSCPGCGWHLTPEEVVEIKEKQEAQQKKVRLGCLVIVAIFVALLVIGSLFDKNQPSNPTNAVVAPSPGSRGNDNTPEMRQLLVKRLNEDSQFRDRLMTKQYVNLVSLDGALFAAVEGNLPTFVMYSDMSKVRGFKDNDPDTTSYFCIYITGMIDQSTLREFGFKQIVFGDSAHHISCQVIAQPSH
jgi:hypothetical protein